MRLLRALTGRRRLVASLAGAAVLAAALVAWAVKFSSVDAPGQAQLERQRALYDRSEFFQNVTHNFLEGEIALADGDLSAAEKAFAAAEPQFKPALTGPTAGFPPLISNWPLRDGLARVKVARGDLKGAIETYRQLLTPDISQKWTAILEPRFVLELARLLNKMGDRAAASAEYQRFLDLWKRADPGLPELEEARRQLGQL